MKSAIDTAYRKYLEYKALAIKEEKAEQAKKEKEKKRTRGEAKEWVM